MKVLTLLIASAIAFNLSGCSEELGPQNRGVYMLMDTSGTYTKQLERAQQVINVLLSKLNPGDTFAVARIDTGSFSETDIVAKVSFDDRPSVANQQKRKFRERIDNFVKTVKPAAYTDITGGLLQAIEYLNEKGPSKKTVLIYSDLKEELKKGYIRDVPLQLSGYNVVALNVTKLRSDNIDPREYLTRLEDWQHRVESGEGKWKVINDMDRLDRILGD